MYFNAIYCCCPPRWCPKQRANRRTWSSPLTLYPPEALSPVWTRTCCCSKLRLPLPSAAWESAWTSSNRPRATARRHLSLRPPRDTTPPTEPPPVSPSWASFQCCYWSPQPLNRLHPPCLSSPLLQSAVPVARASWGSWTVGLVRAWWVQWTSMFVVNVAECCISVLNCFYVVSFMLFVIVRSY